MSADLIAFLKAWYDWAASGAPDGEPFSRQFGLCSNAYGSKLERELEDLFEGHAAPFGGGNYLARSHARTQHECPKRLAWVRARLVEAGEIA